MKLGERGSGKWGWTFFFAIARRPSARIYTQNTHNLQGTHPPHLSSMLARHGRRRGESALEWRNSRDAQRGNAWDGVYQVLVVLTAHFGLVLVRPSHGTVTFSTFA